MRRSRVRDLSALAQLPAVFSLGLRYSHVIALCIPTFSRVGPILLLLVSSVSGLCASLLWRRIRAMSPRALLLVPDEDRVDLLPSWTPSVALQARSGRARRSAQALVASINCVRPRVPWASASLGRRRGLLAYLLCDPLPWQPAEERNTPPKCSVHDSRCEKRAWTMTGGVPRLGRARWWPSATAQCGDVRMSASIAQ